LTLGEVLDGDRMAKSLYKVKFRENQETVPLCKVELKENDLDKLKTAIEDLYYFEFVAGELLISKNKIDNLG
jgi:transmembrane 9 superfamily protein 1